MQPLKIKKQSLMAILLGVSLLSFGAQAHRVWLKPNATVISGADEWVTFDAAIANGIFNPDHHAYPLTRLQAWAPDGGTVELSNSAQLQYRSVFDLLLKQTGTYKVGNSSHSVRAFWQDADGQRQFWPGRGKSGSLAELEQALPEQTENLRVIDSYFQLEVFVTAGAPSTTNVEAANQGLDINWQSHPNDLYTGEPIRLQVLMNGEAAVNAQVTVVQEGERYRDSGQATRMLSSNEQGQVQLQLQQPGMYWLQVEYADERVDAPFTERRGSYVSVIEVLPL